MRPMTSATFVATLRASELLEGTQLSALDPGGSDARLLAKQCLHRGWLTPFQVNQLLQGHGAELILGQYLLLERLGEGGMGQVFKARHRKLGRTVALKVIRRERLKDTDAVYRFRREIEAVASLSHPNVVSALDAGEEQGTLYFVMEYIEGISLAAQVKQAGPLTAPLTVAYARQAALGLQHIHDHGLVHRDIKPSNLLLTANGSVLKILDLGLARLNPSGGLDGSDGALTEHGRLMGTPDFLSAEQAANPHTADIRCDLYSLGCTLYFAVTGQVPFPGGTTVDKLFRHMSEEPTPPERLRREVPAPVGRIIRRLMSKRADHRFQTPVELIEALDALPAAVKRGPLVLPRPFLMPETLSDTVLPGAGSDTFDFDAAAPSEPAAPRKAPARPGRSLFVAGALLGAVMAGLAALVLIGHWTDAPTTTSAAPHRDGSTGPQLRYEHRPSWTETVLATLKANGAPTLEGKWYYIGPFDNANDNGQHKGYHTAYPPEKEIDLAKTYPGKGGETAAWKELTAFQPGQSVDLRLFKDNDWACIYLTTEIEVSEALALPVSLGSDDTLTVWLNGDRLMGRSHFQGQAVDQEREVLNLKAGKNTLLLKICNGNHLWSVCVMPLFPTKLERSFGDSLRRDFPTKNGPR